MVYDHEKYLRNKNKILEYQRQDRLKHKDKRLQHRRDYDNRPDIRERIKKQKKEWRIKNRERYLAQKKKDDKKYYLKTRDTQLLYRRKYHKEYYLKNKERINAYHKQHSQIPEVKARVNLMARLRNKKNPRSNRSLPLDLQFIMNRVRLRDKQTCQWYGCGLSVKNGFPIHVHHIFPQSEYPELAYEERYMICYCINHHVMFHRYRGDHYSEMIGQRSYGILQEVLD